MALPGLLLLLLASLRGQYGLSGRPRLLQIDGAGVLVGHNFQPALRTHPFDIAAQGRGIELKETADLGGPGEATHAPTFFGPMDLQFLDYTVALDVFGRGV